MGKTHACAHTHVHRVYMHTIQHHSGQDNGKSSLFNEDLTFFWVCRDGDDPEYKPAPTLLKDDMEVRQLRKIHTSSNQQAKDMKDNYMVIIMHFSCRMMLPLLVIWS